MGFVENIHNWTQSYNVVFMVQKRQQYYYSVWLY